MTASLILCGEAAASCIAGRNASWCNHLEGIWATLVLTLDLAGPLVGTSAEGTPQQ